MKTLLQDRFFTGSLFIAAAFLAMAAFVRMNSGSTFLFVAAVTVALSFVWISLSNHYAEMRQDEAGDDLFHHRDARFGVPAR